MSSFARVRRSTFRTVLAGLVLLALASLVNAAEDPRCQRTIQAEIYAIDQPYMYNRLGASNPAGMVYALKRDVTTLQPGFTTAGNLRLRPDKRPRPIVLRANQGDCLNLTFRNFLTNTSNLKHASVTRWAGIHLAGLELVGSIASDASAVGKNQPSIVGPSGSQATYTYYAKAEGTFLVSDAADFNEDKDQISNGLFGATHVQPEGAEWYRSQVTRRDLQAAAYRVVCPVLQVHAVCAVPGSASMKQVVLEADDEQPTALKFVVIDGVKHTAATLTTFSLFQRSMQSAKVLIRPYANPPEGVDLIGGLYGEQGRPIVDYKALYGATYPDGTALPTGVELGQPVLNMLQYVSGKSIVTTALEHKNYDLQLRNLDRGFIPAELKRLLASASATPQVSLSDAATVTHVGGFRWVIIDQGNAYLVEVGVDALGLPTLQNDTYTLTVSDATLDMAHTDLTAIITGPNARRFPYSHVSPSFATNPAAPDRRQPYREFTAIYHLGRVIQAFPAFRTGDPKMALLPGKDAFGINLGIAAIGPEIYANRIGVGPMGNKDAVDLKYEEFFLSSWSVGDPAMVVDIPANAQNQAVTYTEKRFPANKFANTQAVTKDIWEVVVENDVMDGETVVVEAGNAPLNSSPTALAPELHHAAKVFYPDDPSNVNHSYMRDHTKIRVLHAGPGPGHVHHLHAHQWLHSPNSDNSHYLDSQLILPGSAYTHEITYNGSGNRNQTVGDSIFHCHFYPHFAEGMWSLWRVHDVFEAGTQLDADGKPVIGYNRALPDGEISLGTPIPALVPLPTLAMAPVPARVKLTHIPGCGDSTLMPNCQDSSQGRRVEVEKEKMADGTLGYKNPGYPFFIPGVAGHRAPHPPMDFAWKETDNGVPVYDKEGKKIYLDGGLPRHLILDGLVTDEFHTRWDFTKDTAAYIEGPTSDHFVAGGAVGLRLPEEGTAVEQAAMQAHATRTHASILPNAEPGNFILNGLPPVPGAPYAAPDVTDDGDSDTNIRRYKAAVVQMDVVLNKQGWHYPQQRFLTLWEDVNKTINGARPPEPFFFRSNTGDSIEFWHTNLVPYYFELDDFEVRTPTDIIGQHIHLVKFDVTSSDGAANGFNYEDGTFSPDEVRDRINAINVSGGLIDFDEGNQFFDPAPAQIKQTVLKITDCQADYKEFCPGDSSGPPGQNWNGAQTTIQRWDADPLLNNRGVDRTLRSVFTHDHFGPSTHQQVGLYAGLLVEPEGSQWFLPNGTPMYTRLDGGPTSWNGYVVPSDTAQSYREFAIEFSDLQFAYTKDSIQQKSIPRSALFNTNDTYPAGPPVNPIPESCHGLSTDKIVEALNAGKVSEALCIAFSDNGIVLPKAEDITVVKATSTVQCPIPDDLNVTFPGIKWLVTTERIITGQIVRKPVKQKVTEHYCIGQTNPTIGQANLTKDFYKKITSTTVALLKTAGISAEILKKIQTDGIENTEYNGEEALKAALSGLTNPTLTPPDIQTIVDLSFPPASTVWVFQPDIHRGWSDPDHALYVGPEPGPNDGSKSSGAPYPQLISFTGSSIGTYAMNYLNEPLPYRINKPATPTSGLTQAQQALAQDMAYVFSSLVRLDPTLNTQPIGGTPIAGGPAVACGDTAPETFIFPCQPLTPGMQPTDPFTPLMRAYANDNVQVRTLVGGFLQTHSFQIQGVKWHSEPSYTNSGYRNAQAMGISEHFEMLFTLPPTTVDHTPHDFADYLYSASSGTVGLVNGLWGILRAYKDQVGQTPTDPDYLAPLPNNKPAATDADSLPVTFNYKNLYEQAAKQRNFCVVATTASLTYNTGHKKGLLKYQGAFRGPVEDKHALVYVLGDDTSGVCKKKETGTDPTEPLILRAAAGEWIKVRLVNDFVSTDPAFASTQSAPLRRFASPFGNGLTFQLEIPPDNALPVSTQVGLHPQLVSYDVTKANGINVGFNPLGTVPVGQTTCADGDDSCTFYWYAGNLAVKENCTVSSTENCIAQTPVEFGATALVPADLVVQHQKGLYGALIIEPEGFDTFEPDANSQAAGLVSVTQDGQTSTFHEFVIALQTDVENKRGSSNNKHDQFWGAINYKYEPNILRGPKANTSTATSVTTPIGVSFAALNSVFDPPEDPETPIFTATAGEKVRFRIVFPGGSTNLQAEQPPVMVLHGHVWQEEPFTEHSTVIGNNPHSQWLGGQLIAPYEVANFVIDSAGGTGEVPGDYMYLGFARVLLPDIDTGNWGIFRVKKKE